VGKSSERCTDTVAPLSFMASSSGRWAIHNWRTPIRSM
jgi:hypothetical protein